MSTILALWNLAKWIRTQRKELEANAEAYLTDERAKEWRREAEQIFDSLANGCGVTIDGEGSMKLLPKPIKWFFKHTEADNHLGRFGQAFLKSSKLANVYRCH